MLKTLVIGLSAIALLLGGGMAFVAWMTRDAPSRGEVAADAGPNPASALRSAQLPPGTEATPGEHAPSAGGAGAGPFAASSHEPFQPKTVRRTPRGAVNGLVAGLGALHPQVERCGAGGARGSAAGPGDGAMLLLDLEPMEGAIRVADARVHSRGKVGAATVDCVRELLVGQLLYVPESRPGRRVSIPYPISR